MNPRLVLIPLLLGAVNGAASASTPGAVADSAHIESLTGAHGRWSHAEGVFRVTMPRSDLDVRHTGMEMTPALGLMSTATFSGAGARTRVTAELCVTPDQANPTIGAALDAGLEVRSLHHEFLWDEPRVLFLSVSGVGDETRLAGAVGRLFAKLAEHPTGRPDVPLEDMDPLWTNLDPGRIDAVLRMPGTLADGVYRVGASGTGTSIAFAGSNDRAVAEGEIAVPDARLQGVLRTLRSANLYVAAILRDEDPRTVSVHFWGQNTTVHLARALRSALDRTSSSQDHASND